MRALESNSEMLRAVAHCSALVLDRKLDDGLISTAHKVAAFLNPRTRHLRHLSASEKQAVSNQSSYQTTADFLGS